MIEREMDYRGSKSESTELSSVINSSEKEQRVDGYYFGINPKLRCTLMGFERNYRIKIPSKHLIKNYYSTNNYLKLNP
jgi:hypothetical protein